MCLYYRRKAPKIFHSCHNIPDSLVMPKFPKFLIFTIPQYYNLYFKSMRRKIQWSNYYTTHRFSQQSSLKIYNIKIQYLINFVTNLNVYIKCSQETFLGPWPARTLECDSQQKVQTPESGPARVPEMSPGNTLYIHLNL